MLQRSLRARAARALCAALGLAVLALGAPAAAATLASASFSFVLGSFPSATFPGVGATGSATSNLGASLGGTGVFNGAFTTYPTTFAAPGVTKTQVVITKNAAGSFTGATPSQVGGNLAIEGAANLYNGGGAPLLSVPLVIGTPNTTYSSAGGVSVTAIAASWTAGTAVVPLPSGSPTAMGSNGLTPAGAGTLVLVTPLLVLTNVAGAIPAFGTLTLTYVPEPGTLVLLGLGVAALAALARRRL